MKRPRHKGGFTLIELLLVAAIMGVIAAVTVPTFVRSIRGNRLRAASRTVVMAGRYARSMAILKQNEMALVFDLDASAIAIYPARRSFLPGDAAATDPTTDNDPPMENTAPDAALAHLGTAELRRPLDRVFIDYVTLGKDDDKSIEGQRVVTYRSNGTCTPYELRITDEQGESVTVTVDLLASAETERS